MSAEERLKILKMIEEGKITAEEGTRLLGALNKQKKRPSAPGEGGPRWLRVRVLDLRTGKETVRVKSTDRTCKRRHAHGGPVHPRY